MEQLLIYLIQVNLLLTIVYVGYAALLKSLTFYTLNRSFFLIGVVFSFVYPFLDVRSWFASHVQPVGEWIDYLPDYLPQPEPENLYSINNLTLMLIGLGSLFFLMRLLLQLGSVWRMYLLSVDAKWYTLPYRDVRFPIAPFSFFKHIYLHRSQHNEQELQHIFKHELAHTKGLHSMDVLLIGLVQVLCWYNPVVYLLRRAVQQNLEFITDQQVLDLGIDRQAYQYNLLHVNRQGLATPITNKFNFKQLKQRIMMMNKKRSSRLELSKYAVLIPVVVLASGAFTINQVEANIQDAVEKGKHVLTSADFSTILDVQDTVAEEGSIGSAQSLLLVRADKEVEDELAIGLQNLAGGSLDTNKVTIRTSGNDALKGKMLRVNSADPIRSGKNPLFVVDGKVTSREEYAKVDPKTIASVSILKDDTGKAIYGDSGKDGVVVITTKEGEAEGKSATSLSKNDVLSGTFTLDTLSSQGGKSTSAQTRKIRIVGNKLYPEMTSEQREKSKEWTSKALVIIDGETRNQADLDKLDPKSIKSIDIFKDKSAIEAFGEQGKNGVMKITTKEKENSTDVTAKPGEQRIRIGSPSDPVLYVVDGKVMGKEWNINKIDPSNIAAIDVLKDKSAIKHYGEEGRNGAIVVTTKGQAKKDAEKKR